MQVGHYRSRDAAQIDTSMIRIHGHRSVQAVHPDLAAIRRYGHRDASRHIDCQIRMPALHLRHAHRNPLTVAADRWLQASGF